jgi:beta-lactamase class A
MKSIILKKIPFYYTIGLFVITIAVTLFITISFENKKIDQLTKRNATSSSCASSVKRMDGFQFIKPILFTDEDCPSERLKDVKTSIQDIIANYTKFQNVTSASVYIRDYEFNDWTAVNETVQYEPGSLFKVPVLIAYLRMNEEKPGSLDKELTYSKPFAINKDVAFTSKSIQIGKKYKVRELLKYMIEYSDNNATALLFTSLNITTLKKLFSDLGLDEPVVTAQQYFFTVQQYSLFMRTLYNASYLNREDSEFAAELLSKCEFKNGIVKGLPKNTKLIHKFGESGTPQEFQLHESAIIYLNNKTYLLTVMTKGKDNKVLSKLIAEISDSIYKSLASPTITSL